MNRYPPTLELDLGNFFDSLFTSPKHRQEAIQIFNASVSNHCKNLLTEKHRYTGMTDSNLADDTWVKESPKRALTLLELYIRALASQKDQAVREKKINVRSMLAERVKQAKTQPRIFARRII
jgi:hypothetical protein